MAGISKVSMKAILIKVISKNEKFGFKIYR